MKEVKLTIDGKEIQLTDEQLKMLGIATRNNPFDRTSNPCGEYFYTDAFGSVGVGSEEYSDVWKQLGDAANYFNDKNFANQVALHQLLPPADLLHVRDREVERIGVVDLQNRTAERALPFQERERPRPGHSHACSHPSNLLHRTFS